MSATVGRPRRSPASSRSEAGERPAPDGEPPRYTVDELAAATGVPSRTIRFYQHQRVLPRPARRGRVALYDEGHAERLRLIGTLQARGLSLRAVRHVLGQASEDARQLGSCFGLGARLDEPWSADRPHVMPREELEALVGDRPPGTIAALLRLGVVARESTGPNAAYRIPSPALLRVTLALQESGVGIETAVRAGDILRRRLRPAARELVTYFSKHAGRGFGRSTAPDEIGAALDALRPLGLEAVRVIFARQIERALRERRQTSGRRRYGRAAGLVSRSRRPRR